MKTHADVEAAATNLLYAERPDVTCRSRAMCARRPTGRNSQVTNANALTATANTANH